MGQEHGTLNKEDNTCGKKFFLISFVDLLEAGAPFLCFFSAKSISPNGKFLPI